MSYEQKTFEEFLDEYKTLIQQYFPNADISSASTFMLFANPLAYLLEGRESVIAEIELQAYGDTATGDFLDLKVAEVGLTRKAAVQSVGVLTFGREEADPDNDYTIPSGTVVSTQPDTEGNVIQFETIETVILLATTTEIDAQARAVVGGVAGNMSANTITRFVSTPAGIDTVTNDDVFEDGIDEETDDDLRARWLVVVQNPTRESTHIALEQRALEIAGVTQASCIEQNRGYGTADVVFSFNYGIPDAGQVTLVNDYLNDPEWKTVTADVEAIAPTAVTLDVEVNISVFEDAVDTELVKEAVEVAIDEFFKSIPIGGVVRFYDLSEAINEVAGVVDFEDLLLDSASLTNVTLATTEMAVSGTITVTG